MKKTRFMSFIMAMIMVFGLLTTTAAAADIHLDAGDATVYVDDVRIYGISAYIDGTGNIRVETESDMLKIFSRRSEIYMVTSDSLIVTDWANYFGYGWSQSDNNLYIYTSSSTGPSYPSDPGLPPDPTNPNNKTQAEVFVNGLRVSNAGVHVYGGEFFIDTSASLRTIFPKETNSSLPQITEATSLRTYANKYKYTMVSTGERVFLYNNGNGPLEVTINGTRVAFPDQQPYVVNGRTMVPIRTLAETLGFTVEWVSSNNGIKLTKGSTVMWVWVGSTTYYINNVKYTMDVKPFVTNSGRTMVPIRFIGEAFGNNVKWDGTGSVPVVRLSSKWPIFQTPAGPEWSGGGTFMYFI